MTHKAILLTAKWLAGGTLLLAWAACVVGPEKCKTGADCPPPFAVCVNQQCVVCRVDSDCTGALKCQDGACVQGTAQDGGKSEGEASSPPEPSRPETSEVTLPESPASESTAETTGELPPTDEPCQADAKRSCFPAAPALLGVGVCTAGVQQCSAGGTWSACAGAILPSPEACNGKDDDCNGKVDDLSPQECYSGAAGTKGQGACKGGTQTCQNGAWSACVGEILPQPEWCDDKDNDCDGKIDEDFPLKGKRCYVGIGPCEAAGIYVCGGGPYLLRCSAKPKPPTNEKCGDQIDNDCDGKVDNTCSCRPSGPLACGSRVGACTQGTQTCRQTTTGTGNIVYRWAACTAPTKISAEICDGIDNNCDGVVDEGCCIPTKLSLTWTAQPQGKAIVGLFATGNSSQIMSISNDSTARLWQWAQGKASPDKELTNALPMTAGAFALERQRYAAFALNNFNIAIWENVEKIRHTMTGHTAAIHALSFSTEGKELLSASADKTVRLWSVDKGITDTTFAYPAAPTSVAFSKHDRRLFAVGLANGEIHVRKTDEDNSKTTILKGHTGAIVSLQWSKDGAVLYSLSQDRSLRQWAPNQQTSFSILSTAPKGQVPLGMAISPDDQLLAVIYNSPSLQLKLWNLANQQLKAAVTIPQLSGAIAWSGIKTLVVGDNKGKVMLLECP